MAPSNYIYSNRSFYGAVLFMPIRDRQTFLNRNKIRASYKKKPPRSFRIRHHFFKLDVVRYYKTVSADSGSLLFSMQTWDAADSCQFLWRHRRVQSNHTIRKSTGAGLADYPPGRSDNQPAPLGRIVGFSMPMARLTTCAGKHQ